MGELDIPVVHTHEHGQTPRAYVFTGKSNRLLTPAEYKRARFVNNLKDNYQKFKEALSFVEHFAVVCELSQVRIEAIRKAKGETRMDRTGNGRNRQSNRFIFEISFYGQTGW